jgi:hypothetical protein
VNGDCERCQSAGSVEGSACQVCGWRAPTGGPLRFSDVIDELRAIAALAASVEEELGGSMATACDRAEALLLALREQFMADVVFGERVIPA